MKTISALLSGALLIIAPKATTAAELLSDRTAAEARMGSFAGARLRVPLGGGRERPQAALAVTATHRSADGVRFSKGAELGIARGEPVSLKLGGRPVSSLSKGGREAAGRKLGVSTVGWAAIGVGAAALLYVGALFLIAENADDRDCSNC